MEVMMYFGYNDNRTDNERYLEDQLEQERQWRREEEERRERERKERQHLIKENYEWSLRSADDWPESLRNQMSLMFRETAYEGIWTEGYFDGMYFTEGANACERALQIWPEEEAKVADKITELERQITDLRDGIRFAVGQRLAAEKYWNSPGWNGVANILKDPDEDPESWLNW